MKDLPRWVRPLALTITVLALLPLVLIGRARLVPKSSPRIHLIQDMDAQPKYGPQAASPLFADGRAMRPPVAGTVEHGAVVDDPALTTGWVGDRWIETMPVSVDETLLRRGRERFDIYCAPCHGLSGYGDGPVSKRAEALAEGTWVIPSSLYADQSAACQPGSFSGRSRAACATCRRTAPRSASTTAGRSSPTCRRCNAASPRAGWTSGWRSSRDET